jgi:hypothetical protein
MTATPFALFARQRGKWLTPAAVATKTASSAGTKPMMDDYSDGF